MNNQELQQKYVELQMLSERIAQLEQESVRITQKQQHIQEVEEALDVLASTEEGKETLVPVAEGIFVRTSLGNKEKVVMNVGAGICIEKTIDDAKNLLQKRVSELSESNNRLTTHMQQLLEKVQLIEKELTPPQE